MAVLKGEVQPEENYHRDVVRRPLHHEDTAYVLVTPIHKERDVPHVY